MAKLTLNRHILNYFDCEKCQREHVPVKRFNNRWLCDLCTTTERREQNGLKAKEWRDREDDFYREVIARANQ